MDNNQLKITLNGHNATAQVFTPYHKAFIPKMKALGAVWDKPFRCWWINSSNIDAVREAMREVFGQDDTAGSNTLTLKLTFSEDWGIFRNDCTLFGKVLSHASSRNSGGAAGEDVTYLSGRPESGGSIKNWCSIVPAKAVIRLDNVPEVLLSAETIPPMATVEILTCPSGTNREVLLEERSRLEARLAELNALLSATT